MLNRLVKAMDALSQEDNDDDTTSDNNQKSPVHNNGQERRKSARLHSRRNGNGLTNKKNEENNKTENIHDSGTESDEEEMETIAKRQLFSHLDPFASWQKYDELLTRDSPPALSATPPIPKDVDTESWNSFGRESGIMTGDNDSDSDGAATPTPNRRRMKDVDLRNDDDSSSVGAEKRRHSEAMNDHPIAWRLRSFTTEPVRPVKVAARRIPVRLIINHPPNDLKMTAVDEEVSLPELGPAPAPKRNRRNSNRPSLDFEKMVETRLDSDTTTSQKPVTRSQNLQ